MPLRRLAAALMLAAYVTSADGAVATQALNDREWPERLRAIASGASRRIERFTTTGVPAVDVVLSAEPETGRLDQLAATTRASLALFNDWLGPYPHPSLTVVVVPWNSEGAAASYPGIVGTRVRLLAPLRDVSAERILIAALAGQYWQTASARRGEPWFAEGLAIYIGTRGIHELLGGRNDLTVRAFGGFMTFPVRAIQLSPNLAQALPRIREFEEVEADGAAQRTALMLHTLERYIGWPALQAALEALRTQADRPLLPSELAAIVAEQRGVDLSWYFSETLAPGRRFDYAVEQLSSEPVGGEADGYRTVVSLRRYGNGVFAGTSEPRAVGASQALPVAVTFGDGTTITDYWDGRDETMQLRYTSRDAATAAVVDPSLMLLLDEDRANNSRRIRVPLDRMALRLALHWLIWLQDVMLSSGSVI